MYATVPTPHKRVADYLPIVGEPAIDALHEAAAPLREARVLHLTQTAFGAGAPEDLMGIAPLMNDLGLKTYWQVIRGSAEFARANKVINEALGGLKARSPASVLDTWARYNDLNALLFDEGYDFVVVHDPQPAGIRRFMLQGGGHPATGKWIWHCHLDLSAAQAEVWQILRSHLDCCYDAAVFAAREYVHRDLDVPLVSVVPPGIDPLCIGNMPVDEAAQRAVLAQYGIDPLRPAICEIARFIRWSDPTGVIDAYRLTKRSLPGLQLVLVWKLPGATAESWRHFERVAQYAGTDPDVHLLSNLNEVGNLEQNVFQRAARVVVHRSRRRGFATTVAGASWKARPVITGRVGIMPQQVIDGKTGYVVDRVDQMAERMLELLTNDRRADEMGQAGREHVRAHFLVTRVLHDYLKLFNTLRTSGGRDEGRTTEASR